ncbi:MAG: peptide chain release factor N(5)-glutamine methyltransferase [Phycisphaerales bacterium]|nr:peptide chain release factor N(5)-glutamine methyltransferase [Phycisphaerales bacterium]
MTAGHTEGGAWTVTRLLAWTREYLQRHGVESPRLCAEILLAHALQCQRIHLFTRHEEIPADAALTTFREHVRLAAGGTPIAYLTGEKEFFSLPLEVNPAVLIPRPETEILVERVISLVRTGQRADPTILDVGTGSGCIIIALARHLPQARLAASDVSEEALAVARRNAARHGVSERIDFRCGDLLTPWNGGLFNLIVSNPPYIATAGAPVDPQVRAHEPHAALFAGPDGLGVIRRLVAAAPQALCPGGHLLMEVAYDQAATVRDLLAAEVWPQVRTYRDGAEIERVIHAQRAKAGCAQVA